MAKILSMLAALILASPAFSSPLTEAAQACLAAYNPSGIRIQENYLYAQGYCMGEVAAQYLDAASNALDFQDESYGPAIRRVFSREHGENFCVFWPTPSGKAPACYFTMRLPGTLKP